MRYIESPEDYERYYGDGPSVFLAGGITGVEDWQAKATALLSEALPDVVVLNPRRAQFDVADEDAAPRQIRWEFTHLHRADVTLFWFPACDPRVTVQPIALFELGSAVADSRRRIVVGVDPAYPRALDVRWQVALARPGTAVWESLDGVVKELLW